MSNRPLWDVRQRHVWLSTPMKAPRLKKRQRSRIGLQAALDRKAALQALAAEKALAAAPAEEPAR